jgi:hypothetical protein
MTAARTPETSPPATSQFVLPAKEPNRFGPLPVPPGREPGTLLVDPERAPRGTALLRREALGLAELGRRLRALNECQQLLLGDVGSALRAVETAAGRSESPGRLAELVRDVAAVLEWCGAVQDEIRREATSAVDGLQAIDLLGLCQDVVHDLGAAGARRVDIVGAAEHAVWGRVAVLGQLVRLALELVDDRTGGLGDLSIQVEDDRDGPLLRIQGLDRSSAPGRVRERTLAEPCKQKVLAFRDAAAAAGLAVLPDATGPTGTGIVLRVPPRLRGPLLPRC